MPYASVSEVPDHVPKAKRRQWMAVWNSTYASTHDEARAFATANGVIKLAYRGSGVLYFQEDKVQKLDEGAVRSSRGDTSVDYTATAGNAGETCSRCLFYDSQTGFCLNDVVARDTTVPEDANGQKVVAAGGWCSQFELEVEQVTGGDGTVKALTPKFRKFIPFVKVDAARREVWGIVTAEVPDKDDEVCDYAKSKPYYKAVIEEMSKATNGVNFFPLREMHQLSAAGKCIGFDFKDADREIVMGFKVVDDDAWKKVDEGVYTGFSQGGRKVGEQTPDPVYKGCMRYTADPSEVSLVDNPCLGVAHFAYVNKVGQVEMRKFLHTEEAAVIPLGRLAAIVEKAVARRNTSSGSSGVVTAGSGGTSVASSAPGAARNTPKAAKANRTSRVPTQDLLGPNIDAVLLGRIKKGWRRAARVYVNARLRSSTNTTTAKVLSKLRPDVLGLDDDLGKLSLNKGMYEVSRLAQCVQELGYLTYAVCNEQQWEGDKDSPLPGMVNECVNRAIEALIAMVQEETSELKAELEARLANEPDEDLKGEVASPATLL